MHHPRRRNVRCSSTSLALPPPRGLLFRATTSSPVSREWRRATPARVTARRRVDVRVAPLFSSPSVSLSLSFFLSGRRSHDRRKKTQRRLSSALPLNRRRSSEIPPAANLAGIDCHSRAPRFAANFTANVLSGRSLLSFATISSSSTSVFRFSFFSLAQLLIIFRKQGFFRFNFLFQFTKHACYIARTR